jgi:hypothetical protein
MGVVYAAYDRARKMHVALKMLRNTDAVTLYRFKNEFRALADLSHPNLIRLYELVSSEDDWFFTMELVNGQTFFEHTQKATPERNSRATTAIIPRGTSDALESMPAAPRTRRALSPELDLDRLRGAMGQLAQGVAALHEAGKLHRDIKPSNVLVTESGRVVLCDFGLVAEMGVAGKRVTQERQVVGTPMYMSPEQAAGQKLSEASDWYSVGVMLYEAVTGCQPFVENAPPVGADSDLEARVFAEKQHAEPAPPSAIVDGIPSDLDRLCVELLRLRPEARPAGREVLARLGVAARPARGSRVQNVGLFGREHHLAELREALADVRAGDTVVVRLHGASGTGKTALARAFLAELADQRDVVTLLGRCYERESVPYKALDSLLDALSGYLLQLDRAQLERLLPPDIKALARLFPVLRRVPAVAEAPVQTARIADPQDLRLRAFGGLRELLAHIGMGQVLVLHLDDLQWGDIDSAALLADLLRPPEPPRMLLIASYRSEDAPTSPLVQRLPRPSAERGAIDVREVVTSVLGPADAHQLSLALFGDDEPASAQLAETITHESKGHPYLVAELVRHVQRGAQLLDNVTLEQVIRAHLDALPEEARSLLTAIAVAGRPVALAVARSSVDLEGRDADALGVLRAEHLVRTSGPGDDDVLECLHDQIRQTVLDALPPAELRKWHERLAAALGKLGRREWAEQMVEHLLGAGQREQAGRHAEQAAAQAAEALAFDRAGRLYRLALELLAPETDERRRLLERLGEVLAHAGRGAEAAGAYLEAAEGASEALDLRRRAAEQFLRSGHFEQGHAVIGDVLRAVGLRESKTPLRALFSLVLGRARIGLRGLRYRAREESEIPVDQLLRIDTCWAVASTLGTSDTIRGADFQTRHLLLALRSGDRRRIARGFAMEAAHFSAAGEPARERVAQMCERARMLAQESGSAHALGLAVGVSGMAAYLRGEWRLARQQCMEAEQLWAQHGVEAVWESDNAKLFALGSTFYLGELDVLASRTLRLLGEAEQRGDLFLATGLRSWLTNVSWLAADNPSEARRQIQEGMAHWTRMRFHVQHFYELQSQTHIDLYQGDGRAAWLRVRDRWPALRRSLLFRVQNLRIAAWYLRARSALLALAVGGSERRRLLATASRDAARIDRERRPWADGLSKLVKGCVAAASDDVPNAVSLFEQAAHDCDGAEMALHAAVARRRKGELIGGDEGRALISACDEWLSSQRVRDPERMVAMMAPEWLRPSE